jgi:D-3-phosphoglycerate dehydrogenase
MGAVAAGVELPPQDGHEVPQSVCERFERAGVQLVVRPCSTRQELAAYAGDADLVWLFGGGHVVTAENLAVLPRCGAIIRTGSGTDNVPVEAATRLGIVVANTPDALTDAVSDHAIALLFAVVRQVAVQDRAVRGGTWDRYHAWPNLRVRGKTLGLVAFGRIPQMVAQKMKGFEPRLLAYDPYASPPALARHGAQAVTLDELLAQSDFVSLHCPLTAETARLIGEPQLRRIRPTAVLINTARGRIVDEAALARALTEGWIAGAGLDVLEQEPPDPANPLLRLNNVVITPHIAGYSDEYVDASWRLSTEAALDLARGRWPRSYVNRGIKPRWPLR